MNGIGIQGKILSKLLQNTKLDRIRADVSLVDGLRLDEFGCDAYILETPGHTAGSISLITAAGDAIIGDVIMGGFWVAGYIPVNLAITILADDLTQAMSSLDSILAKTSGTLYVGHGGRWPTRTSNAGACDPEKCRFLGNSQVVREDTSLRLRYVSSVSYPTDKCSPEEVAITGVCTNDNVQDC